MSRLVRKIPARQRVRIIRSSYIPKNTNITPVRPSLKAVHWMSPNKHSSRQSAYRRKREQTNNRPTNTNRVPSPPSRSLCLRQTKKKQPKQHPTSSSRSISAPKKLYKKTGFDGTTTQGTRTNPTLHRRVTLATHQTRRETS